MTDAENWQMSKIDKCRKLAKAENWQWSICLMNQVYTEVLGALNIRFNIEDIHISQLSFLQPTDRF